MTQTLLEESKLLNQSSKVFEKEDSENHAFIKVQPHNESKRTLKSPIKNQEDTEYVSVPQSVDVKLEYNNDDAGFIANGNSDIAHFNEELDSESKEENNQGFSKHLYPQVVVQSTHEFSDIDSDEEDFRLRRHRKNDSGQGSSVETSSLKSNPTNEFYHVDVSFDETLDDDMLESDNEAIDNVLNDSDFALNKPKQTTNRHSSFSRVSESLPSEDGNPNFTDVPLNSLSPSKTVNTYMPSNLGHEKVSIEPPLKPPSVTDIAKEG
jgi:hypothetical protein